MKNKYKIEKKLSNLTKLHFELYNKANQNVYISRKMKKRYIKKLAIIKLNQCLNCFNFKYSIFRFSLNKQGLNLNLNSLINIFNINSL